MPQNKGKKIVRNLVINEISHVDDPANPDSRVVLWKRAGDESHHNHSEISEGGLPVDAKELAKKLEEQENQISELQKAAMNNDEKYKNLKSMVEKEGMSVEEDDEGKMSLKKAADPEYIEFNGEKIEKSAVPAPILKQIEAQNVELNKMKAEREQEQLEKRAGETFEHLGGTHVAKAAILKAAEAVQDKDAREALMKSLKEADAALGKAFIEKGADHIDEGTPTARLNKMAQEHADKNGVTFHQGFAEVIKTAEGRKLASEAQN
jgi:hypothetical protein